MEYKKTINLLDNQTTQPSKFRIKNWVEINDDSRGSYNINSQIKFQIPMLKSSLCDYCDAYILVEGTVTIAGAEADAVGQNADERNKGLTFKYFAPFTDQLSKINNTQVDNAKRFGCGIANV